MVLAYGFPFGMKVKALKALIEIFKERPANELSQLLPNWVGVPPLPPSPLAHPLKIKKDERRTSKLNASTNATTIDNDDFTFLKKTYFLYL